MNPDIRCRGGRRTAKRNDAGFFLTRPQSCYGDFGVRWHDTAFLPGDMSPGSKARTCPRTPN
ncbi:MAG TPA: hypothetical protein VFB72_20715, partial [Verrucomicrobiae bacterium]|nr:hypothetical protein [Verrucomicrobiae bacterium]